MRFSLLRILLLIDRAPGATLIRSPLHFQLPRALRVRLLGMLRKDGQERCFGVESLAGQVASVTYLGTLREKDTDRFIV